MPRKKIQRKVVGFNGVARSGKDTAGKVLVDKLGFKRIAFADAVRSALYAINPVVTYSEKSLWSLIVDYFVNPHIPRVQEVRVSDIVDSIGWDRAKTEYPEIRKLLQRVGTEGGRDIHGQDCWVKIVEKAIKEDPKANFVITDVRFLNEISFIAQVPGGSLVQIKRDGTSSVNDHVSDTELPEALFEKVIYNNKGVAEFRDTIEALYTK